MGRPEMSTWSMRSPGMDSSHSSSAARMRPRCHESLRREPQKAATRRVGCAVVDAVTDPMIFLRSWVAVTLSPSAESGVALSTDRCGGQLRCLMSCPLGAIVLLVLRRRFRYAELREDWEVEFGPQRFSYKDLYRATEGFSDTHLLGIGGFGRVYRGTLLVSKVEVAVKKVAHDSKQGIKEFISEVVSIGRLQHSNLAPLLGYCRRRGELFLVYEYMPNGSVDKYLHRREGKPILNWAQRWHIIKGIASCLVYLHEEWEKVVIHRDIKASNVLLDGDMNGRLGDFGLARLYDHDADPQTTHVVGTIGYLAPELGHTSKATPLTDVFAFGVFILEVTCGQRPVNPNLEDSQVLLVESVLEQWNKGSLLDAVDKQLGGNYNADEACLALKLGLLCSHPFANARPTMRQVMQYLDRDMPLPEMTPTDLSFQMMTIMQNEGFDQFVMTYPSSTASVDSTSVLTVGR
uniref:non-specific serine/threonine protein kinase n=1 Tax=Aegilops tauschii subsp. strangulata TaxID=200361 RepID=A0A453E4X6_AEGTS